MSRCCFWLLCAWVLLAACNPQENRTLPTVAVLPSATAIPPELLFWETESGTLDTGDDIDIWQFTARTGDRITLKVIGHGEHRPTLTLQTPGGATIARGSALEVTIPADSTYLVQVQSDGSETGRYEIGLGYADREALPSATPLPQIVGVPTPTPAHASLGTYVSSIAAGQILGGMLTDSAPEQVYTFEGKAGSTITITLERVSGTLDPFLTLYSPTGSPLAMDDDSAGNQNAKLRNIRLGVDGVYSIQVRGANSSGEYTLSLIEGIQTLTADPVTIPTATPTVPYITPSPGFSAGETRLQNHAPVFGALARSGDFVRYSFYADGGQTLTVSVLPAAGSGLRPMVEMYGPEGSLLAAAKSSESFHDGGALLTNITAPESGPYLLIVTGEAGTVGDFVLSYGTGTSHTDVFRGDALVEQRVEGFIRQRGMRDVWRLALGAGDVITVAVSPGSGTLDPVVALYDVNNALLYMDDNGGGDKAALIRSAHILQSGIYTVRVHDAVGTNIGVYTLVWRYINLAPTATLVPAGVTILAVNDIVPENQYAFYVFQGQQGQRVRIRVTAAENSPIDPVAVLLGPDGSTLAQGDDSGDTLNPDFIATLPDDGTYTVRVNGYLSGGGFNLTVIVIVP